MKGKPMLRIPGFEVESEVAEKRKTLIYRAVRSSDRARVVLKTSRDRYPSPRDIARFKMAYEIAQRFDHPGLVKCLDLVPFRNALVLVMEDGGGEDLSSLLEQGPMPIPRFLDFVLGLQQFHQPPCRPDSVLEITIDIRKVVY